MGRLIKLQAQDPKAPWIIWRLENSAGQWVGWVDQYGRAFKHIPFEKEQQPLFTGDLADCVKVLLGLSLRPRLVEEGGRGS